MGPQNTYLYWSGMKVKNVGFVPVTLCQGRFKTGTLSVCLSVCLQYAERAFWGYGSSCLVRCLEPALESTCLSTSKEELWEPSCTKLVLYLQSRSDIPDWLMVCPPGATGGWWQSVPSLFLGAFINKGQVAKFRCCFISVHSYSFVLFFFLYILYNPFSLEIPLYWSFIFYWKCISFHQHCPCPKVWIFYFEFMASKLCLWWFLLSSLA